MSANAKLADALLREQGGLYEWVMTQRRGVVPKPWDEVADELARQTNDEVKVGGRVLRNWCSAIEASGTTEGAAS